MEETHNSGQNLRKKMNKLIIGFILLALVIVITVVSSIWIKDVYKDYPKPWAFTYFDTMFIASLIIIFYIKKFIKSKISYFNHNEVDQETEECHSLRTYSERQFSEHIIHIKNNKVTTYNKKFHKAGILMMIFWYFGNGFYNLGLSATSITSSNTLSNVSIVFIFLIKVIFYNSKCELLKVISTLIAGVGIFFIGKFESTVKEDSQKDSFIGDIYVLIGSLCYSIYTILLQKFSKQHPKHFDMMEMFGYIGLYNILIIPFFLIIAHLATIEIFLIPTPSDMLNISINAFVSGIISDLLQSYAIILLSPIMVSFGLTFSIPLSFLYDLLKGKIQFNYEYLLGSILIFVSFAVMIFGKFRKAKIKAQEEVKV